MWWLFWVQSALAAPVGDPVADPGQGWLRLGARADVDVASVTDVDCPHGGDCGAVWRANTGVGVAQVDLLRGVGVFGEVGYQQSRVKEADYRGDGLAWAAGLRLALPLWSSGWWLAAGGRYGVAQGVGAALESGGEESARLALGTASALAAWRERGDGGVSAWAGAQAAWRWRMNVLPFGDQGDTTVLDVGLRPSAPVSAVLGGSLTSQPLGSGYRRSVRLEVGTALRYGQMMGASVWMAARY